MTDQPTRLEDAGSDEPAVEVATGELPAVRTPPWRRRWVAAVAAAVVAVGLAYLAAYLVTGRDLAGGATVLGIEVGNLSRAEAAAKLRAELPAVVNVPIPVRVGEQTFSISPSEAGLSIDVDATVNAIPGRSANPVKLIQALFGVGAVDPVTQVDRASLEATASAIAAQADTEPVNGSVAFDDGTVVTTDAVPGGTVDVPAAADVIADAFVDAADQHELPIGELVLPSTEVEPQITDDEVEQAVAEFAKPAMSGPVVVRAGDESATLQPAVIGSALTMKPTEEGTLEPALDPDALVDAGGAELAGLSQVGRDATIRIQNGRPVVVPGQPGRGVARDALAAAVLPALTAAGDARTVTVELTEVEPKLTTEEASDLGVKEVVSQFSTRFPHADYRNTNIGLALSRIDNTLLLPGEVFSLNDLVGERNAANGFAVGWTIDGGRLKRDYGGGVSQVATTTYHAAFKAGLADVYHQPHSIYFDRYPVGQEATVSWGNFDMAFKNDTPYGVVVDSGFSPSSPGARGTVTVRLWSTGYFRVQTSVSERSGFTEPKTVYDTSAECEPQSGWEGFSITSYRKVWTPDGTLVRDEAYPWTYKPNPTVVCGPEPGKD
ncbi:MAG: VanW family protein [Jiangellaceae bacterium]|nr:VanW family protein [Jiangellaceae bacterium]